MEYPLIVTFHSDDDLKSFFLKHREYIDALIEDSEDSDDMTETNLELLSQLQQQNEQIEEFQRNFKKTQKEFEKKQKEMEEIIALANKRDQGQCSTYIGECQEKVIESDLRDCLDAEFIIDGKKVMHQMDIRLVSRSNQDIFGVEVKDKQTLTRSDLTKFKSDKIQNRFKGGIFLSTGCRIPGILEKEDTFAILDDNELYIYSNKKLYIQLATTLFLANFKENSTNTPQELKDMIVDIYNHWCEQKKNIKKMDKTLTKYLLQCNVTLENGHLYLTTKSQCKAARAPYP